MCALAFLFYFIFSFSCVFTSPVILITDDKLKQAEIKVLPSQQAHHSQSAEKTGSDLALPEVRTVGNDVNFVIACVHKRFTLFTTQLALDSLFYSTNLVVIYVFSYHRYPNKVLA